jgi:hypothetical protein
MQMNQRAAVLPDLLVLENNRVLDWVFPSVDNRVRLGYICSRQT